MRGLLWVVNIIFLWEGGGIETRDECFSLGWIISCALT